MGAESEDVRKLLRQVEYPGFSRDIVASGFVGAIVASGETVEVEFKPDTRNEEKIAAMERDIERVLRQADYSEVRIRRVAPYVMEVALRSREDLEKELAVLESSKTSKAGAASSGKGSNGSGEDAARKMTPLQAEVLEDGQVPEPDVLAVELSRLDVAPAAGYGPGGPNPMSGPREDLHYELDVPVLQWDIDPHDPQAQTFQREMEVGEWNYRIWWQAHATGGLLYVSMQAMKEDWVDHDNNAVPHPIGRSEAVNLVYDEQRGAVVAIYGTVRDFRPFVKAFALAYSGEAGTQDGPETQEAAKR